MLALIETTTADTGALGAVAALAVAATALLTGLATFLTRPRSVPSGPETVEVGKEPPAVVGMLLSDFEPTIEGVPATALDLAGRGFIDIEDYGADKTVLRVRQAPSTAGELLPYEKRVLDHLSRKAVDGVVPTEVMTTGPEDASERWWRGFRREVVRDAQRRGLARRRFSLLLLGLLWLGVIVAFVLTMVANPGGNQTTAADGTTITEVPSLRTGVTLLGAVVLGWWVMRISRADMQRDTDDGREVASRWMGAHTYMEDHGDFERLPASAVKLWEHHLPAAAATGLARTAVRQLPLGAEDARHAWSRVTGSWRSVTVRYVKFRPGWGDHPLAAIFGGLIQGAIAGAIAYGAVLVARGEVEAVTDLELEPDVETWVGRGAIVLATLLVPVVLWSLVKVVSGIIDIPALFSRSETTGIVLRKRDLKTGHWLPGAAQWALYSGQDEHGYNREAQRKHRYYVAVDTGEGRTVRAWKVKPQLFNKVWQDADVNVKATPMLGYVRSLEPVRGRQQVDPTVAAQAMIKDSEVAQAALGFFGDMLEQAEAQVDAAGEGASLDEADADGVTAREKMAQAQAMLDGYKADDGPSPDSPDSP